MEKVIKLKYKLIALLLILVDVLIKVTIEKSYPYLIGKYYNIVGIFDFYPYYNNHRTGINSSLNIVMDKTTYYYLIILGIIVSLFLTSFVNYLIAINRVKKYVIFSCYFLLFANVERFLICLSNNYVLDYIGIRNFIIIDLVDIYVFYSCTTLVICLIKYDRENKCMQENSSLNFLQFTLNGLKSRINKCKKFHKGK